MSSDKSASAELAERRFSSDRRGSTGSPLTEHSNTLRFAGYAAIFNRIDKGGDIIRPGAFGAFPEGKTLPLLWQHDAMRRIGSVNFALEDRRGLRVIGTVSTGTRAGRDAAVLLSGTSVKGLSFGYRVKRAVGEKPRELLDLDVAEISLVSFPMQELARVHLVQQL
ncbi:HK97 family phage prohead protease [Parasphingorhabdus sp.]|uniref:HK97 family phage prohead protease n=1 Tax=Parasphingorhabdus sp. TaxID=2709688 RepID=UPI003C7543F9